MWARRRYGLSHTPSRETRSRATRTSPTTIVDADSLVDACLAVLAQVGEGDAIAISCFWHSLGRARCARPAARARAHLARHDRRPAGARPGRLSPAHRLLPPPVLLAREAGAPCRRRSPSGAGPVVCRLPPAPADGRGTNERLDGERHRPLRPQPARVGWGNGRCARARAFATPTGFRRACGRRLPGAR